MRILIFTCIALALAGCAANQCDDTSCNACDDDCKQRGWIGGDLKTVDRCGTLLGPRPPYYGEGRVVGIPKSARANTGLLVTRVPSRSPMSHAGLAEGDLILAVDGKPVSDPVAFRESIEASKPGSVVQLDVWKQDRRRRVPVQVGREVYRDATLVAVGLAASPHLDLWPFDGNFNVFGLVSAHDSEYREDLERPESEYLQQSFRRKPARRPQESWRVTVIPFSVGGEKNVVSQEAVTGPIAAR